MRRWLVVGLLLVLPVIWWQRTRMQAWYTVQRLVRAGESQRDSWIEDTVKLGRPALPFLVACFQREDAHGGENARRCLCLLVRDWGVEDARSRELLGLLVEGFATFSVAGQRGTLEVADACAEQSVAGAEPALARLLTQAAPAVRDQALGLAEKWLGQRHGADLTESVRSLTRTCLRSETLETRARAMRLAAHAELHLIEDVVPLLCDSAAEMRRAAMLAVGPVPEAIATDELLRWLHDPDAEVRRLCEGVLRGRGLQNHHLQMGKLITDERPATRVEVLAFLKQNADLEPGVWLRRLSHDSSPAVRAATLRFTAEEALADLSDRFEQMAHDDPSPTIRQLARYYLACPKVD